MDVTSRLNFLSGTNQLVYFDGSSVIRATLDATPFIANQAV